MQEIGDAMKMGKCRSAEGGLVLRDGKKGLMKVKRFLVGYERVRFWKEQKDGF